MVLSACGTEEFPCDNGQCVPQGKRCDQKPDCSDESDEIKCSVISFTPDYHSSVPPPPTATDSLALQVSVKITSVREFNLVGFEIALDLIISIKWKDPRLKFYNLRDDILSNSVKVSPPQRGVVLSLTHALVVVTN